MQIAEFRACPQCEGQPRIRRYSYPTIDDDTYTLACCSRGPKVCIARTTTRKVPAGSLSHILTDVWHTACIQWEAQQC